MCNKDIFVARVICYFISSHLYSTLHHFPTASTGGHNDQWCYVMNGDCVTQLASCIEDAGSQEVAITAEVYEVRVVLCGVSCSVVCIVHRKAYCR